MHCCVLFPPPAQAAPGSLQLWEPDGRGSSRRDGSTGQALNWRSAPPGVTPGTAGRRRPFPTHLPLPGPCAAPPLLPPVPGLQPLHCTRRPRAQAAWGATDTPALPLSPRSTGAATHGNWESETGNKEYGTGNKQPTLLSQWLLLVFISSVTPVLQHWVYLDDGPSLPGLLLSRSQLLSPSLQEASWEEGTLS